MLIMAYSVKSFLKTFCQGRNTVHLKAEFSSKEKDLPESANKFQPTSVEKSGFKN